MFVMEIKTEIVERGKVSELFSVNLHWIQNICYALRNGTYVSAACSCGDIDTGGLSLSVTSVLSLVWLVLIPPSRSVVS